jgi:exodeoxyribonuclease V gamma subunit
MPRLCLGQLPEQSAFSPSSLSWRLYDWLCEPEHLAERHVWRTTWKAAMNAAGCLAVKIADVFDQYLLYRDDWLAAWERGELLGLGPDEAWQALLWRELTKDGHPHRARLLEDLLARLYERRTDRPACPSAYWCSASAVCRRTICACWKVWRGTPKW